jgi:hypothetical protein
MRGSGRRRCMTIRVRCVVSAGACSRCCCVADIPPAAQDPHDLPLRAEQRVLVTARTSDEWYVVALAVVRFMGLWAYFLAQVDGRGRWQVWLIPNVIRQVVVGECFLHVILYLAIVGNAHLYWLKYILTPFGGTLCHHASLFSKQNNVYSLATLHA